MDANPASSSPRTRFDRPSGWYWGSFRNAGGAKLRYGYCEPAGRPRARIVLLTGFREFGEKYFETINDLLALEYAVWQLDWYGQGGSERHFDNPQKIGAASVAGASADARAFIASVVPDDPDTPLAMVSHSTGGLVLLRYLHDHPDGIAAAVMSAPLFAPYTDPLPAWLVRGGARLVALAGLGAAYIPGAGDWRQRPSGIVDHSRTTRDPERGALQDLWMEADPKLRMGGVTFGWLDMVFRLTAESMRESFLRDVKTPILIGSAGKDTLVRSEAHHAAARFLLGAEVVSFVDARHELFMETDAVRDRWLTAIDRFLDARLRDRAPARGR